MALLLALGVKQNHRMKNKPRGEVWRELLRNAIETAKIEHTGRFLGTAKPRRPPKHYPYIDELAHLQLELIKLEEWVRMNGLRVCALFEGRDAAGKGGVIKRITQSLNPRVCRVVALGTPTEKERGQWYFQRYVPSCHPVGNRSVRPELVQPAGVEHVMGFCTQEEYREFLRSCPLFEEMLNPIRDRF